MTGRLSSERNLAVLELEGERLLAAAEGVLERPSPTCGGWTVADVVYHLGVVYSHKVAVLRLGRRPEQDEREIPPDDATPEDDLAWCHAMLHSLVAELSVRGSTDPCWTFFAQDQTVGFWFRRMAQETTVHRADVESATGRITPIDADVALDGIDEFVSVMLAAQGVSAVVTSQGSGARVECAGVRAEGSASDVLLWLWGRLPDSALVVAGSPADVGALRRLLRRAGQ